jgi:alkaline phosphatase D
MMRHTLAIASVAAVLLRWPCLAPADEPPFLANGVKVGEVDQTSAIVWTRLCKAPDYDPETFFIPGVQGEVRVGYWPLGDKEQTRVTDWIANDPADDYACQVRLAGLAPGTVYEFRLDARAQGNTTSLTGRFKTAYDPAVPAKVTFAVVTCQGFLTKDDGPNGHLIYKTMLDHDLDFFVHTGDIVYYDKPNPISARTVDQARAHWHRMYRFPNQRTFHRFVSSYFMKDDHDTLRDDCWPGQRMGELTFDEGVKIFRDENPIGELTYRTRRWGKDLQVWLVEGRDFRSPNRMPDGPGKSIWGRTQMEWFKRTVEASDAAVKILISPTPVVGPDREKGKFDNYSNKAFAYEGALLRKFLAEHDMIVINGDRHWQYVSVDPETGLWEFGTGPTSNEHAGGYREADRKPQHRYLKILGGYFLGTVERQGDEVVFTGRHYSPTGELRHEETLTRK